MKARLPENELERLKELQSLGILDTAPEQEYDELTWLASKVCGSPIALVSLVAERQDWFKSSVGLDTKEVSRDISFCSHAILEPEILLVPDTALDRRFAINPLVRGTRPFRFYAGVPLRMPSGQCMGALCAIDTAPRTLSDYQIKALKVLASQVTHLFVLRKASKRIFRTLTQLNAIVHNFPGGILFENQNREVLLANQNLCHFFFKDQNCDQVIGNNWKTLLPLLEEKLEKPESVLTQMEKALSNRIRSRPEEIRLKDGTVLEWEHLPVFNEVLDQTNHLWFFHDITAKKQSDRMVEQLTHRLLEKVQG